MKKILSILSGVLVAALLTSCGKKAESQSYPQNLPPTLNIPAAQSSSQVSSGIHNAPIEPSPTQENSAEFPSFEQSPEGTIDVDLTQLSSTMVYAEVYNIMVNPESYFGKNIKMKGNLAVYEDFQTGENIFAVVIADATACCSQGLEFVLEGDYAYPADYPEKNEDITVVGQMRPYNYNGFTMFHLEGARFA